MCRLELTSPQKNDKLYFLTSHLKSCKESSTDDIVGVKHMECQQEVSKHRLTTVNGFILGFT